MFQFQFFSQNFGYGAFSASGSSGNCNYHKQNIKKEVNKCFGGLETLIKRYNPRYLPDEFQVWQKVESFVFL